MFSLPAWLLLSTLVAAPADVDLVVFMAQDCPHCQQLRPELEELRTAGYRVQEVDALAHRSTAVAWKVESVPTLIILRNQKEIDRVVGRLSKSDLIKRLPTENTPAVNPFASQPPTRSIGSISDAPSLTSAQNLDGAQNLNGGQALNGAQALADDRLRNLNRESQVVTASATTPAASFNSAAAKQKALAATVRLRIESENMQSNGSGTVIWTQNGEALIITCGHIFRDMKSSDQLFIDFYRNGNWVNAPGQVLQFFADKHDIGMVRCTLPFEVEPVGINYSEPLAVGSPVFSIGCDRGTPPAIQETQITCLNRYLGEPNIEVAGAPVDGRSGGGLFDAQGNLVGICNAADHQDNEGIYAGQGQIIYQLQTLSLQIPSAPSAPAQRFAQLDTARGQNEWLPQEANPASSAASPAASSAATPEVIMIVRDGKNPPREVRVAQPTPELLNWIDQQSITSRHP